MTPRVLFLDDSPTVLAQAELLLGGRFDLEACSDWIEANAAAHARPPDAVVVDWRLGPFMGTYLVSAFRTFFGPELPVVLISADPAGAAAAAEAGATRFVAKDDLGDLPDLLTTLIAAPPGARAQSA